jgi:hypothetical protein
MMISKSLCKLDPDQPGAPGRMEALELAGMLEDRRVIRFGESCTVLIAGRKPVRSPTAVQATDLPDRVVRQFQLGGDPHERLALLLAADDFLTGCHG